MERLNLMPQQLTDVLAEPVGQTVEFLRYWRVLTKHKWRIASLVLLAGLFSALLAFSFEPVYRAKAILMVDTNSKGFSPVGDAAMSGWVSFYETQTYLNTQLILIRSRGLAEDVVDRLELWKETEFDPRQKQPSRARFQIDWARILPWSLSREGSDDEPVLTDQEVRELVVDALSGGIDATVVPDTDVIELNFMSGDPELATRIVNEYADAYVELGLESRLERVQRAANWLTVRLEGLRGKLEASETALQQYRDEQGLVDMEGAPDLTDRELSELSDRLVEARVDRDALARLYTQVKNLRNLSGSDVTTHPVVLKNPIIQTLKTEEVSAEREVSGLAERYGAKHPKMVAARRDLETVRAKLSTEIANTVASVRKQLDIAGAKVEQFEAEFASLKDSAQRIDRKEFKLGSLQRDVEANRQLYEMFLTRFKETDLGADLESTNARIVDTAVVPDSPIKPRKVRIILVGVFLALMLGIGLAFLLEYLDNTVKNGDDLESVLGIPMLGSIPLLKRATLRKATAGRMFQDRPKSEFAEAIRTVRTGVVLSGLDHPHRVILVTSSFPSEGKTTVTANLAMAMGHLDRVLLIDCDLRRASVGKQFGLDAHADGLADVVAGTQELSDCIYPIEGSDVSILPAGTTVPNPLELLSSQRFADLLETVRGSYDRILLDSPPAQAVSDALVLAQLVDSVLFVIKADATPLPLVRLALRRLRQVQAPIIGAVLNQFDFLKAAKYGYGHYGKYRRYSYAYSGYSQYSSDRNAHTNG